MSTLKKFIPPETLAFSIDAGGESAPVNRTFRYYYIKEANYSDFDIKLGDGGWIPADLAFGYRIPADMEPARSIQFRNRGDNTLSLVLIIAEGEVVDHRVNLVNSRNGSAPSLVPNQWTTIGTTDGADSAFEVPFDANRAWLCFSHAYPLFEGPSFAVVNIWADEAKTELLATLQLAAGAEAAPGQNLYLMKIPFKGGCWVSDQGIGQIRITSLCFG